MTTPGNRFIARSVIPGVEDMEIIFVFIQPGVFEMPDSPMYDLTVDIAGHPAGSTVSRRTLEELGYTLPNEAP